MVGTAGSRVVACAGEGARLTGERRLTTDTAMSERARSSGLSLATTFFASSSVAPSRRDDLGVGGVGTRLRTSPPQAHTHLSHYQAGSQSRGRASAHAAHTHTPPPNAAAHHGRPPAPRPPPRPPGRPLRRGHPRPGRRPGRQQRCPSSEFAWSETERVDSPTRLCPPLNLMTPPTPPSSPFLFHPFPSLPGPQRLRPGPGLRGAHHAGRRPILHPQRRGCRAAAAAAGGGARVRVAPPSTPSLPDPRPRRPAAQRLAGPALRRARPDQADRRERPGLG